MDGIATAAVCLPRYNQAGIGLPTTQHIFLKEYMPQQLREYLSMLLQKYPDQIKFKKNLPYPIDDHLSITLSHSIIKFTDEHNHTKYYAVDKGPHALIGKGWWGKVKGVALTICHENNHIMIESSNMVIKSETYDAKRAQEMDFASDTPWLEKWWEWKIKEETKIANAIYGSEIPIPQFRKSDENTYKSYFVTPMHAGVTLDKYLQDTPITFGDLLKIYILICKRLQQIHSTGYVHRDLKLENIIYNPENNTIHIVDFGVAKSINATYDMVDRMGWGTPLYIPPELEKKTGTDVKTDIYFLGALIALTLGAHGGRNAADNFNFSGIFNGLGISEASKIAMQSFLRKMLNPSPQKRPELSAIVHFLQSMIEIGHTKNLQQPCVGLSQIIAQLQNKITKLCVKNAENRNK